MAEVADVSIGLILGDETSAGASGVAAHVFGVLTLIVVAADEPTALVPRPAVDAVVYPLAVLVRASVTEVQVRAARVTAPAHPLTQTFGHQT